MCVNDIYLFKFQNQDLKDLAAVVEHMRQLNVRTVEQLEKQKIKTNSALGRLEQTQGLLSEQLDKCSNKDLLMRTLVRTHHMFSRILNFMFVIGFLRKHGILLPKLF